MQFEFNKLTDRRGTDSLKYDFAPERGMPEDVLPLWVADMDIPAPPCILDALKKRVEHGIFGYTDAKEDYAEILKSWFQRRFDWEISPDWIVKTPGVVFALHTAIRGLTEPGDAVLIQQPVYYPFSSAVTDTGRKLVVNELIYKDGKYGIDFADFESKIKENQVKVFILCSPHNPVSRVWTETELCRMGEICLANDVLVISDEIHADFVYPGHSHHVYANLDKRFAENAIICTAPSKTFNIAGLQISNILIPNPKLRKAFRAELGRAGYSQVSQPGLVACKAAYKDGEDWLEAMKKHLAGNIDFVKTYLKMHLPLAHVVETQGTYLVWIDLKALALSEEEINDRIVNQAKLWLDAGTMFGAGGEGFQRINVACPRPTLEEAMKRFCEALS